MSGVTGPISTLPGTIHKVPDGITKCDYCEGNQATKRVQGETDSYAAEMHDVCDDCYQKFFSGVDDLATGKCEWCSKESTDRKPYRDYDEGFCGPVYYVCGECRKKHAQQILEEYNDLQNELEPIMEEIEEFEDRENDEEI